MGVISGCGRIIIAFLLVICFADFAHSDPDKEKPIKLIFSTYLPTSYEYIWLPCKHFTENVEKRSGGRVRFELFHSNKLFNGVDEFQALERGDIDMSSPIDIYHTKVIPELGISNLPFLFNSIESLQKALDAGLWDLGIRKKLLDHNIVVLGVVACDPYQVYSKDFQVVSPKDIQGKKWAVSGTTHSKAIEILGGIPEFMGSGKLYMAFQKGKINGCTRPLTTGRARQLYEVIDYINITNFSLLTSFLSINKNTWDSLPEDIQQIMKEEAVKKNQEHLSLLRKEINSTINFYKNIGVGVHHAGENEIETFRKAMMPVYDWWLTNVPDGQKYIGFVKQINNYQP